MIDILRLRQICASPAINIAGLAKQAGITRRYLIAVIEGDRTLTDKMKSRISPSITEIHSLTDLK